MNDDRGIQRQPNRSFHDGRPSNGDDPERFRRQAAAPSYGWLLALVLLGGGVVGLLSCAGVAAMWLFLSAPAAAPPPPRVGGAPQMAAPKPEQPMPAKRNGPE